VPDFKLQAIPKSDEPRKIFTEHLIDCTPLSVDDKTKAAVFLPIGRLITFAEQLYPCLFDLAEFAEHVEKGVLINALGYTTDKHLAR